ncbi:MAG TPA: hypothetical protein VNO33_14795 [Kofleriaceae bacterium]|nr:hypothetical protein [Kofleriaceae bacterium]
MRRLFTSLALLAGIAGCKADRDQPVETGKAIDETRDEAAETRADIQDKQEQLGREEGDVSAERNEFIAATERTLTELDRQIEQLRTDVKQRATELNGEARRDLEQRLTDLENARAQAQTALDRFRQATADQASKVRQDTETAVKRTRAAYDALRGQPTAGDEDPDMKGIDRGPAEPGGGGVDVK